MKKYFIILILLILVVLVVMIFKDNGSNKNAIVLGKEFTLKINQKVNFNDKLNIKLENINDSRCPSGAQCIWQGEIGITIKVNNFEYNLGSVLKTTTDIKNTRYAIDYLPEYNTKTATLRIYEK